MVGLRSAVSAVAVTAPAKVNLTLCVRGRRDDGYHLLDSLVVFAGAGDVITAAPAKDVRLTMRGPFVRALLGAPDNLVMRAARFLKATRGKTSGADLVLEKNLPVAAGIGGGSSDAAATLIACARLWNAGLDMFPDSQIAAALGADVPVCLRRKPAVMGGIGDVVTDAPPLPPAWFVLVNPGVPLATRDVFGALAGRFSDAPLPSFANLATASELAAVLRASGNDLAAPALELMPAIGDLLTALDQCDGCLLARMSGSGPTCFGLFAEEPAARAAAARIKQANPTWWSIPAPLLQAGAPL